MRGCLGLLALALVLSAVEHVYVLDSAAAWWVSVVLGTTLALAIAAFPGLLIPFRTLLAGLGSPSEWNDGKSVVLHGPVYPSDDALLAPMSARSAVYWEYQLGSSATGKDRRTHLDAQGIAWIPSVIRIRGQDPVRISRLALARDLTPRSLDEEAARRFSEHLLRSPLTAARTVVPGWADVLETMDESSFRIDRTSEGLAELVARERLGMLVAGSTPEPIANDPADDESADDELDPVSPGTLLEALREGGLHWQEKSIESGQEITVSGRWRARERMLELDHPLRNPRHYVSARSPRRIFVGELVSAAVGLVLWPIVAFVAHAVLAPEETLAAMRRLPLAESVVTSAERTFEAASSLRDRLPDPGTPKAPPSAPPEPGSEAWSAIVKGTLSEINVGGFRFVDGIAWHHEQPTSADDPEPPGLRILLSDRSLASTRLARSPCIGTHVAALLTLRDAGFARLVFDAVGQPHSLEMGHLGRGRVTTFASNGDLRVSAEQADDRMIGTLRHDDWGRVQFDVPVATVWPREREWLPDDEVLYDAALTALQALRDNSRARNLDGVLEALRFSTDIRLALGTLGELQSDLDRYDQYFLDSETPVRTWGRADRLSIRMDGTSPSGGQFVNFAHFRPCRAQPVLSMVAVNPQ